MMNSQKLQAEPSPPDLEALLNQANWQVWTPPDGSNLWNWLHFSGDVQYLSCG
jgi:hypothetical protein